MWTFVFIFYELMIEDLGDIRKRKKSLVKMLFKCLLFQIQLKLFSRQFSSLKWFGSDVAFNVHFLSPGLFIFFSAAVIFIFL